jgi:hypothetical protein
LPGCAPLFGSIIPFTSPPEQKPLPAPVKTTQRTSSANSAWASCTPPSKRCGSRDGLKSASVRDLSNSPRYEGCRFCNHGKSMQRTPFARDTFSGPTLASVTSWVLDHGMRIRQLHKDDACGKSALVAQLKVPRTNRQRPCRRLHTWSRQHIAHPAFCPQSGHGRSCGHPTCHRGGRWRWLRH